MANGVVRTNKKRVLLLLIEGRGGRGTEGLLKEVNIRKSSGCSNAYIYVFMLQY